VKKLIEVFNSIHTHVHKELIIKFIILFHVTGETEFFGRGHPQYDCFASLLIYFLFCSDLRYADTQSERKDQHPNMNFGCSEDW
jgi:hypothetical protein